VRDAVHVAGVAPDRLAHASSIGMTRMEVERAVIKRHTAGRVFRSPLTSSAPCRTMGGGPAGDLARVRYRRKPGE